MVAADWSSSFFGLNLRRWLSDKVEEILSAPAKIKSSTAHVGDYGPVVAAPQASAWKVIEIDMVVSNSLSVPVTIFRGQESQGELPPGQAAPKIVTYDTEGWSASYQVRTSIQRRRPLFWRPLQREVPGGFVAALKLRLRCKGPEDRQAFARGLDDVAGGGCVSGGGDRPAGCEQRAAAT
eukprot:COSAG04_NODE_186_length_21024_cov_6.326069_5_plen_180_part_00